MRDGMLTVNDQHPDTSEAITFTCRQLSDEDVNTLRAIGQNQGPVPGILGPDETARAIYLKTKTGETIYGNYAVTTRKDPS